MNRFIFKVAVLMFLVLSSCDNANDLLNQYIKDGPIIYAAKINEMTTQSGYYRYKVNIYPAEDVNRSYCILSWKVKEGVKDSIRLDYTLNNFDNNYGYYFTVINISPTEGIEGNLEINAQNVDTFGNRSLIETGSAYIYGANYISSLINAQIHISSSIDQVIFESKIGMVGNFISYEQNNGSFTEEVFVTETSYPLTDAKIDGLVRTKTRYKINDSDIDALDVTEYLETKIHQTP